MEKNQKEEELKEIKKGIFLKNWVFPEEIFENKLYFYIFKLCFQKML